MAAALVGIAAVSSFAQFGAVSALTDVARHFGQGGPGGGLRGAVGLSGGQLGLGLGVLRAASLGALPLASLADRRGRAPVLVGALALGLTLTALAAASPSYAAFVALFALARPLLSTASALVQVMAAELATHRERVTRLALVAAGSGLGAGLSAVLHAAVRGPEAFRWLFAAAAVPLLFVPLVRSVRSVPLGELALRARLGRVGPAARRPLGVVATVAFVVGMVTGPANGFAFVYGEGVLKMSPGAVATVVTSSALTGLAGLWWSRRLTRRYGRRPTVALGVLATALSACLAYGGGRLSFAVGYLAGIGAAGLLAPAASALTVEIFERTERATAAGWVVAAGVGGAIAGLALFGFVGDAAHASGAGSLRVAALVTFLPLTPLVALLGRLPEAAAPDLAV